MFVIRMNLKVGVSLGESCQHCLLLACLVGKGVAGELGTWEYFGATYSRRYRNGTYMDKAGNSEPPGGGGGTVWL